MFVALMFVVICMLPMHKCSRDSREGFNDGWLASTGDFIKTTAAPSAVKTDLDFSGPNPVLVTIDSGAKRLAVVGDEVKLVNPPTGTDVLTGVWALIKEDNYYCLRNASEGGKYFVCEDTRCTTPLDYSTWDLGNASGGMAPGDYHIVSQTCNGKNTNYLNVNSAGALVLDGKADTEWTIRVYAMKTTPTFAPTYKPTFAPTFAPTKAPVSLTLRTR